MVNYTHTTETEVKQTKPEPLRLSYVLRDAIKVYKKTEVNATIKINRKGGIILNKLYTCEEVADRYGVKVITVWDWIRKGRLRAIAMPKGYRISEDALTEYEGRKTRRNLCLENEKDSGTSIGP